jgi:hypothetical protein
MVIRRQPQRPTGQVKRPVCRHQETGTVHRRGELWWPAGRGWRPSRPVWWWSLPSPADPGHFDAAPVTACALVGVSGWTLGVNHHPGPGDAACVVLCAISGVVGRLMAGLTGAVCGDTMVAAVVMVIMVALLALAGWCSVSEIPLPPTRHRGQ